MTMTEEEFERRYISIAMGADDDWCSLIDTVSTDKEHGLDYLERIRAGLMNRMKRSTEVFGEDTSLLAVTKHELRHCEKAITVMKGERHGYIEGRL